MSALISKSLLSCKNDNILRFISQFESLISATMFADIFVDPKNIKKISHLIFCHLVTKSIFNSLSVQIAKYLN